jgi:acyl-CoA thioesterase YciA
MTASNAPQGEPTIRITAMPKDNNPAGDIFGGWLMSLMDLAAGNAAATRVRGRCVTAAVDSLSFINPVAVGDEVSLYARVASVGRTSLKVWVEAWRRQIFQAERQKVTEAMFTFVAVDENRRPRPIPPEA